MVPSIFRHAKSVIVSDGSSVNGFECNDNVEDGNAEHSDILQVVREDRSNTSKHSKPKSSVGLGKKEKMSPHRVLKKITLFHCSTFISFSEK